MSTMRTSSRTETRLETHRREFRRAEFRGPLIRIEELSRPEIDLINGEFLERCKGSAEDIDQIYSAYVQTLHSWGVICPHPQHQRMYDGYYRTHIPQRFEDSRWYTCNLCQAIVINR